MSRRLAPGSRLVIASHNLGKLREFAELLAPFGVETVSAGELGLPEPEETGATFAENALLKARAAADAAGLPALADDSGLEVARLGGAPGIYSARWGGPDKDFAGAMRRVRDELLAAGATFGATPVDPGPRANFNATLVIAWPECDGGQHAVFEGKVFGTLQWPPRGAGGFGYDPMFQPDGHTRTFGEMTSEEKHGRGKDGGGLSHRARACAAFIAACVAASDAGPDRNG